MDSGIRGSGRVEMVLKAYKAFFRKLAFEQLPRLAERYLGSAGFRVVVDALAEATIAALPSLIDAVKGFISVDPQADPLDVLEIHYKCHSLAREITGDMGIGLFSVKRVSPNELRLVADKCPFNAKGLQLAAFVGVVVGVLRALGVTNVTAASSGEGARHAKSAYIVYPVAEGEGCSIVVERRR